MNRTEPLQFRSSDIVRQPPVVPGCCSQVREKSASPGVDTSGLAWWSVMCDLVGLSLRGKVAGGGRCGPNPLGKYGVSPENIILYGQSIGTVPTVDLASRYECAAVILHSPLMSGLRVAFPDTRKTYCFDAFPSIDKISKVTSPVLVIHGTEDEVIDFSHGLAMYERCPRAVEPLWVEGAGHNDIELYAQYLERLKQFISHELPNS
ncbi:abhydrolase domain-containing protein [Camelus ferus]|nr:abhydrolase domain-containing protein [Camelus ferus]